MGKTKTAFVGGVVEPEMSGKAAYEAKMKKKEEKKAPSSVETMEGKQEIKVNESDKSDKAIKGEKEEIKNVRTEEQKKVQVPSSVETTKGEQEIKVNESDKSDKVIEGEKETAEETQVKRERKAKIRGKRYLFVKSKIDKNKFYSAEEAVKLVRGSNFAKFDATVELHIVAKRKGISENVTLPHSFGKEKRIEVASDETVKKLQNNKVDFDLLLATAEMMPKLVPFARLLGPKGLMPNPKNGTLIKSEADAKKFSASAMTVKTEKDQPVIHTVAGKLSQKDEDLSENIKTVIEVLGAKNIDKVYLKSTMSPSVKVQI